MKPDSSVESPFYTGDEVAALLGISPRTLRQWIKDGRFPAPLRFGYPSKPCLRFCKLEVEQFIAAAAREATACQS